MVGGDVKFAHFTADEPMVASVRQSPQNHPI